MAETGLTPETRIEIATGVLFTDIEDEAVILHAETGLYYGLNEVGSRMWRLLGKHGRLGAVHECLLDEYDVTAERLWEDLVRLVGELLAGGMVRIDAAENA